MSTVTFFTGIKRPEREADSDIEMNRRVFTSTIVCIQ